MRILHVITSLRIGGAEKLLTALIPATIARGHQAEVALLDATPTLLTEQLRQAGVKVHALGHGYRDIYNPLKIGGLRRLMRDFDIVHTHNTTPQFFAALASVGLGNDKPRLVTTEHNTSNRRRAWRWFNGIDRWMYGRYDRVISVNDAVSQSLQQHLGGRLTERMTVIDNGIDYRAYADARPTGEFASMFPGKTVVAMVAAFRKQKDHATLLRAMAQLPGDYALVLAGDGETRPAMEALATQLGISDRVAFLGFRTDVAPILRDSDIVVLSTHYEGMSLSLIEGMASGRPLIASDVDGVSGVAEGAALLFPEGDSRELAQLIAKVAADQALADDVAQKCQLKAQTYDISHTINSYLSLYEKLKSQTLES